MNEFTKAIKNSFNFEDRTSRSEFWIYQLVAIILSVTVGVISVLSGLGMLSTILSILLIIPSISITIRRLHDIDKSGWWFLIVLVPLIGLFFMLYFSLKGSVTENNTRGNIL